MQEKRKDYIGWDAYFMGIAMLSAQRSKDPNTQVGACIVSKDKKILSVGYTANVDVTTSRKAKITFSAEGVDDVVVDIVQSDKTFTNPIAGIPDPWIVQYQGAYYTCKAHGNGINVSKSNKLTVINSTKSIWTAKLRRDPENWP